jgi:hypothetical protein
MASAALAAVPVAPSTTLVLVVASNRGPALDRPPLQYADDDGAKYHEVFASLAGETNTTLLTEFDSDTARLFPQLAESVATPTRAHVEVAVERFARQASQARRLGQRVGFYFVFAGHGDVDEGRGFLELADSAFTADDLDALLRRIGADESHVILDSCNSFFVVNPRKPGGRRFATPRDAAEKLARQLPNVGVFLSTSAEAEVFEWSELQSGVFSHAVRSGLMGAADANHDGRVSYEELAGFVATAAAEIKNPLYRPKVFARGPNGDDERTLFDLSQMHALTVTVEPNASMRLAVRDRDGLRWLDAHKEAGQVLDLRLPTALAGHMEVERLTADGAAAGTVEARFKLPEDGKLVFLAQLAPDTPKTGPRGAQEIFRGLFVRPFGTRALNAYREEHAREPEPVFGISREDSERMGLLLEQLASAERQQRLSQAGINFGMAAVYGAYFGLAAHDDALKKGEKVSFLAVGILLTGLNLGLGLSGLTYVPERERIYRHFRADMASPGADEARVAAAIETRLQEIQEEERHKRKVRLISGYLVTGLISGFVVANELNSTQSHDSRILERGFGLAVAGTTLALTLREQFSTSATQKFIELWRKDPRHRPLDVTLAPLASGAMCVLSGSF